MEQRKNILFIPRWYPFPEDEMYGLFIRNHAEILSPKFSITVVYAHPVSNSQKTGFNRDVENGIVVYRHYFKVSESGLSRVFNPIRYLFAISKLWKALKKDGVRIDLCHVHVLTRTALLAYYLKITRGIPYLITEHWSRYLSQNRESAYTSSFRKALTTFLTKNSSGLSSVTKALETALNDCGISHSKQVVIPNVVDTDRFCIGALPKSNTLLHVGCFDEKAKNIKGLLRTVKKLNDDGHEFKLKLVGTGIDWQLCVDYAAELGLTTDQAEFTGLQVGDELVRAYQECKALVLFSHYETQGVVILEAFACGKPVIASNTGGIPELMNPERGILVKAGDENELFSAIKIVLNEPTFAAPEEIRAYAVANYSESAVAAQFETLYKETLTS